jgi:hypothetical protein
MTPLRGPRARQSRFPGVAIGRESGQTAGPAKAGACNKGA